MYRTTRDIMIPAGTKVAEAPRETRHLTPHASILIGFDKDTTGDLRVDVAEAERAGMIERCDEWGRALKHREEAD